MKVAVATAAAVPAEFGDDARLVAALHARGVDAGVAVWNDPGIEWDDVDTVVIRSTWDYTQRLDEFLAWADAVGERLRNRPRLVRWNSDKRYLADLRAAGLPVVETVFVEPGASPPALAGEVVVKPAVSAGARDTGRFGPPAHGQARALLDRLGAEGRTAIVQPYLDGVDERGETAIVFLAGQLSHALRKAAVLRPDEEAPLRADGLGAAEAMYREDLVTAAEATPGEVAAARRVVSYLSERFGAPPLYLRVDLLQTADGDPVVLEVEAVEPHLYFDSAPGAVGALADLIAAGA